MLGVEFEDVVEQVAFVRCHGDCNNTSDKMEYHGIASRAAAKLFFGGSGKCTYGCLGLGDCAAVCPHDAICIKDGLARVGSPAARGLRPVREKVPQWSHRSASRYHQGHRPLPQY